MLAFVASAQISDHAYAYKPFSITSRKLGKEMSSDQLEKTIMCKKTTAVMAETMDLLQNYDLVDTEMSGDRTLSTTTFRGKQAGRIVQVDLVVDLREQRLAYVLVDGKPTLQCKY